MAEPLPFISVVIPAFNAQETLRECLNSVLAQDYPKFEVIVVDDCSSDQSREIAREFAVKLIELEKRSGAQTARNTGIKVAKGEIIAFTDADCLVPNDWLKRIAFHLANGKYGGVGGIYDTTPEQSDISRFATYSLFESWYGLFKDNVDSLNTGNCAYLRQALIGIQDKNFELFKGMAAAEDTLISMEISRKYPLIHDDKLKIIHKSRDTIPRFFHQQITRGYSRTLLSFFFPKERIAEDKKAFSYILSRIFSTFMLFISPLLTLFTGNFVYLFIVFLIYLFIRWRLFKFIYQREKSIVFVLKSIFFVLIRDTGWIVGLFKGLATLIKFKFKGNENKKSN